MFINIKKSHSLDLKQKKHKKPIGAKEKISERYEEPFLNTKWKVSVNTWLILLLAYY